MAQGIAWNKEKVIEALRPFFLLGYSVTRACACAGIPQPTVQTWIDADEELRLKIHAWQETMKHNARQFVADVVSDTSGKYEEQTKRDLAKFVLDRTDKDYKPKQEMTGEDGQPIVLIIGKKPDEQPTGNTDTTSDT